MKIIILLVLVMLAASAAACGDSEQALSPVSSAELEGTTWFLASYGSASSPKTALDSAQASVSFDNYEDLHGFVGCNYFGKHFEIEELRLITDELQRTRFSCPEDAVMVQDAAVMSALQTIRTIGFDEDFLVIGYETGELRFEKKPPPPTSPLTGTQWELTSIVSGGEVRPVIEGIVITAAFQEGFMNGGSGCNNKENAWNTSMGFKSQHPGGCMFVFCDGSVHFLSETIDYTTYQALGDRRDGEVISADAY